jgi:hypothetical protein
MVEAFSQQQPTIALSFMDKHLLFALAPLPIDSTC